MNKIRVARLLVLLLCLSVSLYAAPPFDSDIDAALNSAESIFQALKKKDYQKIWSLLTEKSKGVIVDDVYKAEGTRGKPELTRQSIGSDFSGGGPLSRSYWNAFLDNFNPDTVLAQSKWDIGKFEKDRGEIVIKYRKSEGPVILQMHKEKGSWKVGLVETFWSRRPSG